MQQGRSGLLDGDHGGRVAALGHVCSNVARVDNSQLERFVRHIMCEALEARVEGSLRIDDGEPPQGVGLEAIAAALRTLDIR